MNILMSEKRDLYINDMLYIHKKRLFYNLKCSVKLVIFYIHVSAAEKKC